MFNFCQSKLTKGLLSILFLMIVSTACNNNKRHSEIVSCDLPELGNIDNSQSQFPQISINVDGSGSMIGYVEVPNSNYIQTIQAIANVVFTEGSTKYQRIGDSQTLTRDNFRQDAISVGFYDGSDPDYSRVSSPIQEAIQPPAETEPQLTVIITDLEGDDGALISERLRQYYFTPENRNQGYTVGVWAVKSQFDGNVYDPNTGQSKFYYNTKDKSSQEYRPFYVLFIGKYDHIQQAFDDLRDNNPNLENNSEMVIFPTNNILRTAVHLGTLKERESSTKLPDNNQIERFYVLDDDDVIVERKDNEYPYEFLGILHQEDNPIKISYKLPFPLSVREESTENYSLIQNNQDLQLITKTKVFTFGEKTVTSTSPTSPAQAETETSTEEENNIEPAIETVFVESSNLNLQNGLTVDKNSLNITGDKNRDLQFDTVIDLNNLSNPQVYLFEVDLIVDDIKSPDWWQDWDSQNAVDTEDGSKTQNILSFMNKLKKLSLDSLGEANNPGVIGRLCFGVDKD